MCKMKCFGLFVAACASTTVQASEVRSAYGQPANVSITSDTVQADPLLLGDGTVHKTGAGTWTVPQELIAPFGSHEIVVHEGALAFTSGAAAPAEPAGYATATNLIRKYAAMWVSTQADERNLVFKDGSATDVAAWRDVRDTNAAKTNHWFATAIAAATTSPAPKYLASYADATRQAHPAISFNGYGSGTAMQWKKASGGDVGVEVRNQSHFFAVHCVTNRIGPLFSHAQGAINIVDGIFPPINYHLMNEWSQYMMERSFASDVRGYRNGSPMVPYKDYPTRNTYELYELHLPFAQVGCNAFFTDRSLKDIPRYGGDLLCEAIVFTNRLAEAERVCIENYLLHKWNLGANARALPEVTLASGTTLTQEFAADKATVDFSRVKGRGTFNLTGSGTAIVNLRHGAAESETAYAPSADITTRLRAPTILAAQSGSTVSTVCASGANKDDSPVLTVASGGTAGVFTKNGNEEARVSQLPDDLVKLDVKAGRLLLTPPAALDAVTPDVPAGEIPLDNPSFETPPSGAVNEKEWNNGSLPANFGKWQLRNDNPAIDSHAMWIRAAYDANPSGEWSIRHCFLVGKTAHGIGAMGLKMAVSMRQRVQLDHPGTYCVSFWFCGRWNMVADGQPWVFLVSADGSVTNTFCKNVVCESRTQMTPVSFETTVATAGAYDLVFRNSSDADGSMTIDDIHLSRVPSTARKTYRIPGGDFEGATFANRTQYTKQNTHPNWTFTHDASATTDTRPSVALATPFQKRPWLWFQSEQDENPLYPRGELPRGGWTALVFLTNGTAATTFTPPKGRWQLRSRVKPFWAQPANLTLGATAGSQSLGEIGPFSTDVPQDAVWPTAFEADGTTAITLTLRMNLNTSTARLRQIWLDDLELVAASDVSSTAELVKDGGFENVADTSNARSYSKDWALYSGGNRVFPTSGESVAMKYVEYADSYGRAKYEGERYQHLCDGAFVTQTNNYPAAGFYRLTFAGSCRCDQSTTSDRCVEVTVANGAETNLAVQVSCWYTNFVERSYDFYVPSAGKRELRFRAFTKAGGNNPGFAWQNTVRLDGVSLKAVPAVATETAIPAAASVSVAQNAKLYLAFAGTNEVDSVRIGGARRSGVISAERFPAFIEGPGALFVNPKGSFILLR